MKQALPGLPPDFAGSVFDYATGIPGPSPEGRFVCYPGVMTAWDNTARRREQGHIFAYASPREYELWLRAMVARSEIAYPPGERFVFINAWNEYVIALTMLRKQEAYTLPLQVVNLVAGRYTVEWNYVMAAALAIPPEVGERPVRLGHPRIVFLDAPAHLGDQRLLQRLRRHKNRFSVAVLRLQV